MTVAVESESEAVAFAQEKQTLARELAWLIDSQFPVLVKDLLRSLKQCLLACTPVDVLTGHSSNTGARQPEDQGKINPVSTIALTSLNSDALKGFVTLNASLIVKADVILKFSKLNKGNPYRVTVTAQKPWLVEQIQNSHNYLALSYEDLETFFALHQSGETEKDDVIEILERVADYVSRAKDAILFSEKVTLFPSASRDSSKVFSPPLPDDLVVEFYISYANLVVSVNLIQNHAQPPSRQAKVASASNVGKVIKYEQGWAEILDHVQIEATIPSLKQVLNDLTKAYSDCHVFLEKLRVVS